MEAERFGKLGRKLHGSSAKRWIFPVFIRRRNFWSLASSAPTA
jgi:hypothetical protein